MTDDDPYTLAIRDYYDIECHKYVIVYLDHYFDHKVYIDHDLIC